MFTAFLILYLLFVMRIFSFFWRCLPPLYEVPVLLFAMLSLLFIFALFLPLQFTSGRPIISGKKVSIALDIQRVFVGIIFEVRRVEGGEGMEEWRW